MAPTTQVAILPVPVSATPPNIAATSASVTFYIDQQDATALSFSGDPGHEIFAGKITKGGEWVPGGGLFFFWQTTTAPAQVFWNNASTWTPLVGAPVVAATVTLGSAPATNVASSTPNTQSVSLETAPTPPTQAKTAYSTPTISPSGTSISNSTSTQVKSKTGGGVSGGSVAGIAIGCLIAGALIAGFLAWFLLRRSRNRVGRKDQEASRIAFLAQEKEASGKIPSVESRSPTSQILDGGLPQPLEDQAITGDMSKLSILIKNHVQSFYHTGRVSPGLLDLDDLQALGADLPLSTGTLSTLIGNSNTREIALRFCIAWVLVSRMKVDGGLGSTFLPPEVIRCFQSMSSNNTSRDHAAMIARWRTITAELLRSTYASNTILATDPRSQNIRGATDVLDGILRPYMDSRMKNDERRRNLEEISKRAASFAFTLFSQPSTWTFDWKEAEGVKSGSLCIFPALVQVTDEFAQRLPVPRPFSEAVVRQLDG